ncbi:Rgp1-domain-containing protein [Diplogelasinospora grovesii]|uniref:Rgp1-domain-containing protein n=1 Tax=Diplogelasinospora grovesii TaxID=303347 RepID=A0AAN6SAU9_9PEZI|nr:Rgp1-domain-containing protein [Diplogelasinospora grovesii]
MSPDGPTSSSSSSSNIRVYIRWHDQVVFAGEEVKCTITFKNVAAGSTTTPSKQPSPQQQLSSRHAAQNSNRPKPPTAAGLAPPPARGHHRSSASLSLTVPSAAAASRSRARAGSIPWSPPPNAALESSSSRPPSSRNGHGHKRSVSILSIGSSAASTIAAEDAQSSSSNNVSSSLAGKRPARGHARASSLQIVPRAPPMNGPRSATHPHRLQNSQSSSPLFYASYPPDRNVASSNGHPSGGTATVPSTPGIGGGPQQRSSPRSASDALSDFKFPWSPPQARRAAAAAQGDDAFSRPREPVVPIINEHGVATATTPASPVARILSTTSIAGTPRSSGEFFSLSNNSSETLASEYVTQQPPLRAAADGGGRSNHSRRTSNLVTSSARLPEALMMGYAQVQGSFTLDGSLVNLEPFEQVKRKAVVGGQGGGGVIGVETTKRDSGLLRSFGWGNITSSIGELLGGGELSTIKEMRGQASSKSIPLLSTPQSILFVDLQLAPGESKSFEYAFKLPKGLPPTHRGKTIKISYSLVIGTQRPPSGRGGGGARGEQQVKSVDVPFRVLGSVNSHGELLGHDLMSPYVILGDQARVNSVDKGKNQKVVVQPSTSSTLNSFLSYVDELLAGPQGSSSSPGGGSKGGLLSPSAVPSSRRPSSHSLNEDGMMGGMMVANAKEAIDLAILRANVTGVGQQSANRFEIARNGRKVGVVMLVRPAYRLGEVINLVVDFSGADIPCYAVHAALETAEKVDPGLALRSEASIQRVTRKVYVTHSETTLFAQRVVFTPTIPATATPEFVTSGVSLEWKVRLEFVVPAHHTEQQLDELVEEREDEEEGGGGGGDGNGEAGREGEGERQKMLSRVIVGQRSSRPMPIHPLLEEISRDDRGGLVLVAAENLTCESFEVAVPLRVYGAVCTGLERLEKDEASEEGLVV